MYHWLISRMSSTRVRYCSVRLGRAEITHMGRSWASRVSSLKQVIGTAVPFRVSIYTRNFPQRAKKSRFSKG